MSFKPGTQRTQNNTLSKQSNQNIMLIYEQLLPQYKYSSTQTISTLFLAPNHWLNVVCISALPCHLPKV